MIEKYNEEIKQKRELMSAVAIAMNELFKLSAKGTDRKVVEKQKKMFDKLRQNSHNDKFNKKWNKYEDASFKNLQKLKNRYVDIDLSQIEKKLKDDYRRFNYYVIESVMGILKRNYTLNQKIEFLSSQYEECLTRINTLKEMIVEENTKQAQKEPEEYKKIQEERKQKLTEEQLDEKRESEKIEKINESAEVLLKGPNKGSFISVLQGEDKMFDDMEYLYGLSIDILILMNLDQNVDLKIVRYGDEANVWNAYMEYIYIKETKVEALFKSYGVSNVDGLLNKYETIRKSYYKKYSKLSNEKKLKYGLENFRFYEINSSLSNGAVSSTLLHALKNEKLNFPPSKDKLISLINGRIMNGKNYHVVSPREDEKITVEPENISEYHKVVRYYKKLTKNMSIEEVSRLYNRVVNDLHDRFKYSDLGGKTIVSYSAIVQKIFCEIIFDKKNMKFSDIKQHDHALNQIAKEYLKEDLKYSINGYDNVNEEEKKERKETIQKEYIKYRAKMTLDGKKDFLSFTDFVQQKYALNHVEEPKNLKEKITKEIKGMKR